MDAMVQQKMVAEIHDMDVHKLFEIETENAFVIEVEHEFVNWSSVNAVDEMFDNFEQLDDDFDFELEEHLDEGHNEFVTELGNVRENVFVNVFEIDAVVVDTVVDGMSDSSVQSDSFDSEQELMIFFNLFVVDLMYLCFDDDDFVWLESLYS